MKMRILLCKLTVCSKCCVAKHKACGKGSKMAVFISVHHWVFCPPMSVHFAIPGPVLSMSRTLSILIPRISAFRDLPAQSQAGLPK